MKSEHDAAPAAEDQSAPAAVGAFVPEEETDTTGPEKAAVASLIAGQGLTEIQGVKLRRVTAFTLGMLMKMDNPFVAGKKLESVKDVFYRTFEYLFIQSAPLSEVIAASNDPKVWEEKVWMFSEKIPADDLPALTGQVMMEIQTATGSRVTSDPDEEDGKAGNG